jgi:hypothetical protein
VLDNVGRGRYETLTWALDNGHVQVVEGDICDRALVAASSTSVFGAAVELPTREDEHGYGNDISAERSRPAMRD